MYVSLTLELKVHDPRALRAAAMRHAVNIDNMDRRTAREIVGSARRPNVTACLQVLLDPGRIDGAGFEIEQSTPEVHG